MTRLPPAAPVLAALLAASPVRAAAPEAAGATSGVGDVLMLGLLLLAIGAGGIAAAPRRP